MLLLRAIMSPECDRVVPWSTPAFGVHGPKIELSSSIALVSKWETARFCIAVA